MTDKELLNNLTNWKTLSLIFPYIKSLEEVKRYLDLEIATRNRYHIVDRLMGKYISIAKLRAKEEIETWSLKKRRKNTSSSK